MTRVNLIPVETLHYKHLISEFRELPRIFKLTQNAIESKRIGKMTIPKQYTLGTGHCLFFMNKLSFLAERQKQLVNEMIRRGYKPTFTDCLYEQFKDVIPKQYWNDYVVTQEAVRINVERINERLKGMK